jgi:cyclase
LLKLEQVSKSTWAVIDGSTYGNVGCIRLPAGVVIIDTGMMPPVAKEFRELVYEKVGQPITDVILTHYHSDHVFGAQEFRNSRFIASSIMAAMYPQLLKERWSPAGLKELIEYYSQREPEVGDQLKNLEIILPSHTFEGSMVLGKKEEIIIQHTGGHTAGHSMVFFKPEQILFAGDLVFCQEYPYAGDPTNNPIDWMNTFTAILEMPIKKIVPGHGPLCDKQEIRKQLAYFKALETWIQNQVREKVSLKNVLEMRDSSPPPPYTVKVDNRLESTIERWYHFYSKPKS